jgi:Holliday junction resolvasome RuvABC endonuclease subunit
MDTTKRLTVLSNDPSLTAWGYSVINDDGIKEVGCIKTKPEYKKRRIGKGDDTTRRVTDIVSILLDVINIHEVNFILSELPHGSQNSSAAQMIGITVGIVQTMSECLNIPVLWFFEGDAKKSLIGKTSCTKQQIIDAVDRKFKVEWTGVKYKDEAIADSISVYNAALRYSEIIQMFHKHGK